MDSSSDHIARRGPGLALVSSPLRLASEGEPMPLSWSAAVGDLAAWLGVDTAIVPAPDASAPVFAPWTAWSAAALHAGGYSLPPAQFVASYCLDYARNGGVDVMLLSPVAAEGTRDLPGCGAMRAMIRAAVGEGRERIAVLCHARQHAALTALRLGEDRALCSEGFTLQILSIEDAIPALMTPRGAWDAVIAMPELRSIVFTLIAESSGVRGPWPMLWHNRGVRRVTSEVKGEGSVRLQLDAAVLVQTLALALHASGRSGAARQLHTGWAALRDRGVGTPSRGSDAPYATEVAEEEFIAFLARESARPAGQALAWRALGKPPMIISGIETPTLRVISASSANH